VRTVSNIGNDDRKDNTVDELHLDRCGDDEQYSDQE
jgi:hypothetical protein